MESHIETQPTGFFKTLLLKSRPIFSALLITFSLSLTVSATHRDECYVYPDLRRPILTHNYDAARIPPAIKAIMSQEHLSESKAKGVLGERIARQEIENSITLNGKRYISIFTFFNWHGCKAQQFLRNNADNGIDDIFITLKKNGTINRKYNPIFHEAKFDKGCRLKLNKTETICQQLSFNWIRYNLQSAYHRVEISFAQHNSININLCNLPKRERLLYDLGWLQDKLENGHFHRTASLLCANGQFKLYPVH